jgi:diaminopimelate epimerase
MTAVPFCKFHGFGNDYIVVERDNVGGDLATFTREICHRHTGAGSDGIAALEKLDGNDADYFCEIVNPDGSIAGFSGNGTRCAAAYLYYKPLWSDDTLRLETRSGIKTYRLIETISPGHYAFEAEVGKPKFASDDIPVTLASSRDEVTGEPIAAINELISFSAVNVGNPVACVFADEFTDEWRSIGRAIESHEMFPERTNVVFVKIVDRENVEVRIWERGAGETAASGTCSAGAAVMSAFQNKTDRDVNVHSPGGMTHVQWREDGEIVLTGRADLVYCGEWPA